MWVLSYIPILVVSNSTKKSIFNRFWFFDTSKGDSIQYLTRKRQHGVKKKLHIILFGRNIVFLRFSCFNWQPLPLSGVPYQIRTHCSKQWGCKEKNRLGSYLWCIYVQAYSADKEQCRVQWSTCGSSLELCASARAHQTIYAHTERYVLLKSTH